jgi:1,4-alpha-glucan branching enzyme
VIHSSNPALRSDTLIICHEDNVNQVLAFKRWQNNNVILTIVNLSETSFSGYSYGVATDWQFGQWQQILCSQDADFGGWDNAGNAFYEPWTQADGRIYIKYLYQPAKVECSIISIKRIILSFLTQAV